GLMISVSNTTSSFEHLHEYQEAGVPLVLFDRVCNDMEAPRITTDDTEASFKATELLLRSCCRKCAFLSMADNLSICSLRRSGYAKALAKYGLADREIIVAGSPDDENNRVKIRELLQQESRPDAIFAAVEKLAVNTYEVCDELNNRIPQQLKVISFSNLTAAALFNPSLSTVVQPAYQMGVEAATILFKIIGKKTLLPNEKKVIIPSYLVERKSTGNQV